LRVVSADATRRSLFGEAKRPASYGEGVYTEEANRLTYRTMIERGRGLLGEDRGVVLDATFLRHENRARAEEMAKGAFDTRSRAFTKLVAAFADKLDRIAAECTANCQFAVAPATRALDSQRVLSMRPTAT
jgi:predicted kinase